MITYKRTAQNSPWLNFTLWTTLTSILVLPMYCAVHWDNIRSASIAVAVTILGFWCIASLFIRARHDSYVNKRGKQPKPNKIEAIMASSGKFCLILLFSVILYLLLHAEIL